MQRSGSAACTTSMTVCIRKVKTKDRNILRNWKKHFPHRKTLELYEPEGYNSRIKIT